MVQPQPPAPLATPFLSVLQPSCSPVSLTVLSGLGCGHHPGSDLCTQRALSSYARKCVCEWQVTRLTSFAAPVRAVTVRVKGLAPTPFHPSLSPEHPKVAGHLQLIFGLTQWQEWVSSARLGL